MLKNIVQRLSGSYSKAEGYLLRNPFNRFSSVDGTVTRPPADDVAVTKDDGSKLNTEAQRTLDLLDKWKKRFQDEKVTEIQPSLEIILAHVLEKRKVGLQTYSFLHWLLNIFSFLVRRYYQSTWD